MVARINSRQKICCLFETFLPYNVRQVTTHEDLDSFKQATQSKVCGLRCPTHGRTPEVRFTGSSLRDVTIRMSGCCEKLMHQANAAIAGVAAMPRWSR